LQQRILHNDRQAESDQQRRQNIAAERSVEHEVLQGKADAEHNRHGDQQRREKIDAEHRHGG
jgi:hypothetical protein